QEVEINRLKERVKILEDKEGVIGDRSGDDAPIKGRRIYEEEIATEKVSSDTEEVRLDEGEKLQEQIDAQIARELKEQLEIEDQRRSEQIARDEEIARIHAEEELQIMI
nr:hypothetical protein [Tanacetum cinerariifolium]